MAFIYIIQKKDSKLEIKYGRAISALQKIGSSKLLRVYPCPKHKNKLLKEILQEKLNECNNNIDSFLLEADSILEGITENYIEYWKEEREKDDKLFNFCINFRSNISYYRC